ncbi:MAG: hypothetical protein [Wendovervirus sonii]|uniref:Virion structural protein n=1 Tax=phage Lak_Megaphage_Sonny TaxID=3109229 RepID=A0ABZ0Z2I3_9CAUD|nr:MAG: hypothetical protein [phage Lak_Megaphage_Sonny]
MKQLYKKLYEAINTGIQRALVLDDDEDVSIIYQHKKIVNNENLLPYYVSELLKGVDIEYNYEQIINYYKETKNVYKVADISELMHIYKILCNKFNNEDLTWIDTSNALLLFDFYEENNLYSFHQYDKDIFYHFDFIQLKINENISLYISRFDRLPSLPKDKWHTPKIDERTRYFNKQDCIDITKDINLQTDLNGYEHTYENININYSEIEQYPILDYIINMKCGNNHFMPYLPAISELLYCYEYQGIINYAFTLMGVTKEFLNLNLMNDWWSSSELNDVSALYIFKGFVYDNDKIEEGHAFPLYKKIF